MALRVYNYLTRKEEEFQPLHEGFVGMYVCGPTVYGDAHIGHAKVYVTFDVVHRYFEHLGYRVRYVQNITDVGHLVGDGDEGEDKIGRQARREQIEPMEIVESYTRKYFRDMDQLNIIRPDISPRASGHVPEQIELTQALIDKGHAYESNGNVYFSVASWPDYGKLSRRKVEELAEGVRLEVSPDKRDPRDFAVWRAASPEHLMKWNSPWGSGFPGWHAECTVMARKYLGLPFDIHGGGLENIFPHNESEIAQCEAAYGQEFARYWLLNNLVTIDGTKMGKSLGNSLTIQEAITGNSPKLSQGYAPLAIRFFILSSHYRQTTDFSDEALKGAAKGYERLMNTVALVRQMLAKATGDAERAANPEVLAMIERHQQRFFEAMDNDFNTPQALATLFDFNKQVNTLLNEPMSMSVSRSGPKATSTSGSGSGPKATSTSGSGSGPKATSTSGSGSGPKAGGESLTKATLEEIDKTYRLWGGDILGLIPDDTQGAHRLVAAEGVASAGLEEDLIGLLVELRTAARKNKDFATSDAIRDQLAAIGVVLEDRPDGTAWKISVN